MIIRGYLKMNSNDDDDNNNNNNNNNFKKRFLKQKYCMLNFANF